jgi:hypothetical protein
LEIAGGLDFGKFVKRAPEFLPRNAVGIVDYPTNAALLIYVNHCQYGRATSRRSDFNRPPEVFLQPSRDLLGVHFSHPRLQKNLYPSRYIIGPTRQPGSNKEAPGKMQALMTMIGEVPGYDWRRE